ncbi:hypothetical protein [uncultured Jatrophihabitans sp.]|uniref:hypothetical protein n=1 Tax=uncultured Jatrophihabitans sp. TaxID=1610747 RepID=UPI0035C9B7B1
MSNTPRNAVSSGVTSDVTRDGSGREKRSARTGWSYRELFDLVDRQERRAASVRLAVLIAAGVSIGEAEAVADGRNDLNASDDAQPQPAPVSLSLGEIILALAGVSPNGAGR